MKKKFLCVPKKLSVDKDHGNNKVSEGDDDDDGIITPSVSFVDADMRQIDNTDCNNYYQIKSITVGDLKCVAMALGKVNMEGAGVFFVILHKDNFSV